MWRKIVGLGPFLILLCSFCGAQTIPENIRIIIEQAAADGTDESLEELFAYYETLMAHPLKLNNASRQELERTRLLSLFQVQSIIDYRNEYGDILSVEELSLVDGFNKERALLVAPVFDFSSSRDIADTSSFTGIRHTALLKGKNKWAEKGLSITGKYKLESDKWTAGLTFDSDAGEPLTGIYMPDFLSATASYSGNGLLKRCVAGDYTAQFGQGLVVWKGFTISSFSEPSATIMRGKGISPYTSSSESGFFRGAAATLSFSSLELSLLASAAPVDARIVGDTAYTSIQTTGLHRSQSELEHRHSMLEYLAAANLDWTSGRWCVGFTLAAYMYDKHNGRRVMDYNRFQQYDGLWGNAGLHFTGGCGAFRIYGEAALDRKLGFAALAGTVWSPLYELEMSLSLRMYGKDYIATHAGAFSASSNCSNQYGSSYALKYSPLYPLSFNLNGDYTFFPWSRYGVQGPSWLAKARIAALWSSDSGSSASLQVQYKGESTGVHTIKLKCAATYTPSSIWSISSRGELNSGGGAVCIEGCFKPFYGKLEMVARLTYYNTDGWDNRVYLYERDVPQSFGTRALYGRGFDGYLMVKWKPMKNLEFWAKASRSGGSYFIRILLPG